MTRHITESFRGLDRRRVWVEVDGVEHNGEIHAWAIEDDPGNNQGDDWWAMCNWHGAHGETQVDWFPASRVHCTPHRTDQSGRAPSLPSNVVPLAQRDIRH